MTTDLAFPRPSGLTPTGDWRVVAERSVMINNAESYLRIPETAVKDIEEYVHQKGWRLRAVRPLFKEELDAGLPPDQYYTDDLVWDRPETHPSLTNALDEFYKIHRFADFHINMLKGDPVAALIEYLAHSYYDCMSGGCSVFGLAVIAHLFKTLNVDRSLQVYPKGGKDEWYNVGDFLEEMDRNAEQGRALPDLSALGLK